MMHGQKNIKSDWWHR